MTAYVEKALQGLDEGLMSAYATVEVSTGRVIGSTRFCNIQSWDWPQTHERFGNSFPDVCEIGYTWLGAASIRTPSILKQSSCCLPMLLKAGALCGSAFKLTCENERSKTAIQRIGGKFEGIIRADRLASDFTIRDTARFSILATDWTVVKAKLLARLDAV